MKFTGIVRNMDELGRVVIPIEMRKRLGIGKKDPVEIYADGDSIILKKYSDSCIFCGKSENVYIYHEKNICGACIEELKNKTN